MSDYKKASELKLRFVTVVGSLTVENLWDLNIKDLDSLAIALQEEYKASGAKSFIVKSTKKDKIAKLKFDIVLDVLTTKVDAEESLKNDSANKLHNAKIDERIAKKQDAELDDMSVEELEKLRK